jgi:uncharacterized membrane protein required for colicin V production
MPMIWVDLVIIGVLVIGLVQGFWRGLVAQIFQVAALVLALVVAFWAFPQIGQWFETQLRFPVTYARPLALVIVFFAASFVLQFASTILQKLFAPILQANPLNRAAGALLGAAKHLVFISFALALIVSLPTPSSVKAAVDSSRFAKPLIHFSLKIENILSGWMKDKDLNSLGYRIVGNEGTVTSALNFHLDSAPNDLFAEKSLLLLTNETRGKFNKAPLKENEQLREVARNHARDMLQRGYFSHVSPQGEDALVRVKNANIQVVSVGENLANAPSIELAHTGLMESEGHRKNILSEEFTEVGIGVLDAGTHGKMVVQVFARVY